jgi:hypothetical protein
MTFKKGSSGNPAGRPAGTAPRAKFRKLVEPRMEELINRLMTAALAGDMQATVILMARMVPPLKPTADTVAVKAGSTPAEQGAAVLAAMLAGNIPADTAAALMAALLAQSKLTEQAEVTARLEKLEALLCPPAKS